MIRNFLRLGKPLLSTVTKRSKTITSALNYKFNTTTTTPVNPAIVAKKAMADHHNNIRLMQSLSTKMEEPDGITRVDLKTWEQQGFLGQMKEYSKGLEIYEVTGLPKDPEKNSPAGSWIRFKYALSSDSSIRDSWKKFYSEGVRVGKMLEIMDYLAGTVAYRYARANPTEKKVTMVTASVYDVAIFESNIRSDKDLLFTGYVCHIGKTSMEIRIDISHSESPDEQVGSAYFMFVARDATDYSKSFKLPELSFDGEKNPKKCVIRNEYGKRNKERKKIFSEKSVFKVPPSSEESIELHRLFKQTMDQANLLNYSKICATQHEKLLLMHVQDKNRHGKVFGGFVMREATELAWMTALLNGDGSFPQYIHIDDVAFVRPIPVGSITKFRAVVSYTEDNLMHVEVTADNLKANNQEERVFEVNVTFSLAGTPKPVIPTSYFDGMLYLEGKRRVNNFYLM